MFCLVEIADFVNGVKILGLLQKQWFLFLLCCSIMSESDIGGMAVDIAPSHEYCAVFCLCATDGNRGEVQ